MRNLRDCPVGQKITFVIMLISGVVLLLAFAALFCFQAYTLRQHSAHELAVVGEITAHNCAAAVMFKDEGAAAQILTGLKTMPQIVSARLEVMDQQRLAYFGGLRDELEIKAARLKSGFRIDGNRILLAQPVMLEDTPDIVMSANPSGIPFYLNRAGHEILGVAQDRDISGMKTLYLHPEWAREIFVKDGLQAAIRHGSWAGETTILARNG